MDVKKIGRIPDGGGWRAHGRPDGPSAGTAARPRSGFDYVHSLVDDHTRLAYSEILARREGRHLRRRSSPAPIGYFAAHGIARIERVMTDNAWAYTLLACASSCADLGIRHIFIRPHCPWQNGKVERFNRTLQTEWAYRQVFTSNDRPHRRPCPLARVLQHSTPPQRTRRTTTRSADCHQPDGRVHLIWSDLLSRGRVRRPSRWFGAGASCFVVGGGWVSVSLATRGQTDMRGLVTAGRCCSAGAGPRV